MPRNEGGKAVYKMTPIEMRDKLKDFIENYKNIRIIGGCCGTNPEHIAELRKMLDEKLPQKNQQ
jgi:5-methyltetrahydrofolate--homocysteine methyltransferase